MNDIPEDIYEAAKRAFFHPIEGTVESIAHAILAERERCASVVARLSVLECTTWAGGYNEAIKNVVRVIRQGQAKEGESA